MTVYRRVSAGLDLIKEKRKQNQELGRILDRLDALDSLTETPEEKESSMRRPYSSEPLRVTEPWK